MADTKPEPEVMEVDTSKTNGERKPEPTEPEALRKLFIGGLTLETDEDKLKQFYSQWGDILDVVVMRDPGSKKSRGFGFISFAESSSVDDAMRNRPHKIDGKQVDPKRAVPRDKSGNPEAQISVKKLFVSGIREDHTEDQLKEYFTQHGEVESADIMREKESGKIRGFAFVLFKDFDSVDKCCLIRSHEIGGYRCDVKKALSREEMRKVDQKNRDMSGRNGRSFRGDYRGGAGRGGWGRGGGFRGFGGGSGFWGGGGRGGGYGFDGGYGREEWGRGGWAGGRGSWGVSSAAERGWGSNVWR